MIFAAHSGVRYLFLLAGFVMVLYAAHGLATKREYVPAMARMATAFNGLLDLQILLGIAVLFQREFGSYLIGHMFMMVFAAIVAHGTSVVVKKRPQEAKTYGPHLVGGLLALALVAGGIMAIPGRGVFQSTL